jgi:ATP-dependent RNA helicase RhlE
VSFDQFDFHPHIQQGIQDLGFKEPSAIQKQAIPLALEGRDVMGLAQTGTGKTAAFVLPMLQRLLHGPRRRIRALVISPTRELAEQTHDAVMELGAHTGLKSIVIYGGVNMNAQKALLRAGKGEIIVACPGRLLDHLSQGMLNLSQVEMLVLDEADRMLDMGFMPDIKRILKYLLPRRQTLMFSATMPDDIRRLSGEILKDYITVQIGRTSPAQNVKHVFYPVERHLKTSLLKGLIREAGDGSILVFTKTKDKANRLGQQLKQSGYLAGSLQGDMTQVRRQAALEDFRDGTYKILVATDVAARGIDVDDISHVINYDLPDNVDDYIHRVGRTGRADKKGEAFSIVTNEDGPTIREFERELEVELQTGELEGFNYTAPPPPGSKRGNKGQRSHKPHGKRKDEHKGRRGHKKT